MILGVDALNLANDRRGMGRHTRSILRSLSERHRTEIALIVRGKTPDRLLAAEFPYPILPVADLPRTTLDAVWYPWNGMRFSSQARSIVTLHDPFAFTFPHKNFVARRREQKPVRRALAQADVLLAGSRWTKGEFVRLFHIDEQKIRVAPNAPDPFWHAVETPSSGPYFLFVAGPEKRKNAAMLFAAFESAFTGNGPQLVVAGNLNAADERDLATVKNTQRLQPDDTHLRALYTGALAVVVPSLAEGFGMTVVEAMACGAPVIASDATALPESAAGAALLVNPSDIPAWSDAMQTVARRADLREDLRSRGLARVGSIDRDAPANALLQAVRDDLF